VRPCRQVQSQATNRSGRVSSRSQRSRRSDPARGRGVYSFKACVERYHRKVTCSTRRIESRRHFFAKIAAERCAVRAAPSGRVCESQGGGRLGTYGGYRPPHLFGAGHSTGKAAPSAAKFAAASSPKSSESMCGGRCGEPATARFDIGLPVAALEADRSEGCEGGGFKVEVYQRRERLEPDEAGAGKEANAGKAIRAQSRNIAPSGRL